MYYRECYYDPVSGRFISADGVENNATGDDPFAYVSDNPETMTDPSGNAHIDQQGDTAWTIPGGNQPTVVSHASTGEVQVVATSGWVAPSGSNYTWDTWGDGWIYGSSSLWTGNGGSGQASSSNHSSSSHHAAAKKSSSSHHTDVVKAVLKEGISVILKGLDLVLGISSMINDWNTLTDSNASFWSKLAAAGDLALNVGMDISMFTGVGEGLKIADIAGHLAEMLVDHGGEDVAEHAAEGAAEACGGLSFAFATKVAVATGEQSIGTLKPGDQVWAYNQQTKKMELEVVRHLWINHDNDLVDLTLTTKTVPSKGKPAHQTSETLHTNKKHPFLTVEKGFLPVAQLKLGMHVVEAGGRVGIVTGWKSVAGTQTMYNLEVTEDHTYTVGTEQWVVHNSGPCTRAEAFNNAKRDANIPTSASPEKQGWVDPYGSKGEPRRVYQFTDSNGESKYIVEHWEDPNGRGPHFHVAVEKDGQPIFEAGSRYQNLSGIDPNVSAHYPEDISGFSH